MLKLKGRYIPLCFLRRREVYVVVKSACSTQSDIFCVLFSVVILRQITNNKPLSAWAAADTNQQASKWRSNRCLRHLLCRYDSLYWPQFRKYQKYFFVAQQ